MTIVDEIRAGVRLREAGQSAEAKELFLSLWPGVEQGDDAFARCFLAHSLADVQDDPREELRWDLLALEAAADVTEERAAEQEVPGGRLGLYPSLHLTWPRTTSSLGTTKPLAGTTSPAASICTCSTSMSTARRFVLPSRRTRRSTRITALPAER